MRLVKFIVCSIFALTIISGCSTTQSDMDYTNFLASNPKSILIMMPSSMANDMKAAPAILATTVIPLANKGYYVLPVTLVNDTFRYNGVTEPAEMRNIKAAKLKEIYGADAVLDLNVEEYGSTYVIIDSTFVVTVSATLYDLNNGKILWAAKQRIDNADKNSSGPIEALLGALVKHVINNVADVGYDLATSNGINLYSDFHPSPILYGPYSVNYRADPVLAKDK